MPTEQKPDILIIRTKTIQSITTTTKDGQTLWDYTYDYDKNGNRIQKQGIQGNTQYTYDSLQRLQEVHYPTGIQEQYTYDNAGNRALRTYGTKENFQTGNYVEERYHYDVKNNLKEKKTNESITSYTYDNQGNTISESVQSYLNAAEKDNSYLESYRKYTYNAFNQTETVTVETYQGEEKQVHTQKNCYDAENMRYGIEEDGESTYFITNGWSVFTELDKDWNIGRRLIRGYGIVAGEEQGTEETSEHAGYQYYHLNEHGDTEYLTGQTGEIKNAYTYDAFGGITKAEELVRNRYTYNGEQYDTISSQYYLRARYYNPLIGRFTQEDVYRGDGLNLYAYCGNNPVMYVDPSGYEQSLEEYYSSIRTYNGTDLQKIPENYRAELDLIVEMNFKGKNRSGTNSAGWERNASKYFKQLYGAHPEYFSANNRELIKNNRSPVVDNQFVKFFPKYENYVGDTLIHHHIGGGGQVAAYPKSLHDGYGGVHNYEKLAGITGNDRLTNRAQTIEEGIPKEVKSRKKASSNKKSSKKCNS